MKALRKIRIYTATFRLLWPLITEFILRCWDSISMPLKHLLLRFRFSHYKIPLICCSDIGGGLNLSTRLFQSQNSTGLLKTATHPQSFPLFSISANMLFAHSIDEKVLVKMYEYTLSGQSQTFWHLDKTLPRYYQEDPMSDWNMECRQL
jgi:hypothetical protein